VKAAGLCVRGAVVGSAVSDDRWCPVGEVLPGMTYVRSS
jgi:hypothetical protein